MTSYANRKVVLKKHPDRSHVDFAECFEVVEEKLDDSLAEGAVSRVYLLK